MSSLIYYLVEERGGAWIRVQLVPELLEPVALVLVDEQLTADAPLGQRAVDLFGLAERHARIVGAVDHEERRADPFHVRQRRRLEQEVPVPRERAVLPLAERPPPLRRFLEEGDEARDADELDPRGPPLRLECKTGEDHVAAVRAAVEHRARRVDPAGLAQRVLEGGQVAHR